MGWDEAPRIASDEPLAEDSTPVSLVKREHTAAFRESLPTRGIHLTWLRLQTSAADTVCRQTDMWGLRGMAMGHRVVRALLAAVLLLGSAAC